MTSHTDRTELEKELIEALREIELSALEPTFWTVPPGKASNKLDELTERGVLDEGSRRYDEDGNRITRRDLAQMDA